MKLIINILIILLFIIFHSGCKTDKQKDDGRHGFKNDTISFESNLKDEPKMYHRFPSAREMLTYIKTGELSFQTNLTNPVSNLEKYHSTRAKMLNLGVYLTDLSYMILFDRTQETDRYFNAIFNLSTDLRIKVPEEEKLINRISENIHNSDSLITIAEEYQTRIINYLLNTEQEKVLATISTGSYIEGLYISVQLINRYNDNKATIDKIVDQKHAFKNLAKFAQSFDKDINISYSLDCLEEINLFFDKLPVIEEKTEVKRSDEHTLILEGGERTEINEQQFRELKTTITEIRTEVVQNKMKVE